MLDLPEFNDPDLWLQALTHSSYANEHPGCKHNEQLEFVGDAVLKMVLSVFLYQHHPQLREGALTIQRSELERNITLAKVATRLHLGKKLRLGKGTRAQGGQQNDKILSGALEAILGAYFLEAGLEPVRQYIEHLLLEFE
jgi:ribonuclease-3